jgi:predicted dehydrogenase
MKIILIGTGPHSVEYLNVLKTKNLDVVVLGNKKESCLNFENKTGIKAFPDGINYFLDNIHLFKDVNYAIVSVSQHVLCDITLKIMKYIKNILIEKPAGVNSSEIYKLYKNSIDTSCNLYVGYNRRFYSSVLKLKELLKEEKILSATFDFSERTHILNNELENYHNITLNNWVMSNSSHILDLIFYLIGEPKNINTEIYGYNNIDWHKQGSIFQGNGITDKNIPFSYHSNWLSPGGWGIEINTNNNKYILKPLEILKFKTKYSDIEEYQNINYDLDNNYKPGLMLQVGNFLDKKFENLLSIKDHFNKTILYYQPIYKGHSKKYILIVGFGNIGYRHYQSLISENKYIIYVVEPNIENYKKVTEREDVIFFNSIDNVPNSEVIDIAIISTQANIRHLILKKLTNKLEILNIIFEKPLCQSIEQLNDINTIIKNKKIKAWVNTTLILHPLVEDIKKMNINKFDIYVYGNWDICCNLPHYLILWCYLNNCFEFDITNNLFSEIFDSKRAGNHEVKGNIKFTNNKSTLNIFSGKIQTESKTELIQILNSEKLVCYIDTNKELYNMTSITNDFIFKEENFEWPRVSKYTREICRDILEKKSCNLIELENFSKTEKKLLIFYEKIFKKGIINIT